LKFVVTGRTRKIQDAPLLCLGPYPESDPQRKFRGNCHGKRNCPSWLISESRFFTSSPFGFGKGKVRIIVPQSEENEAGRINIHGKRSSILKTPVPLSPHSTSPSPDFQLLPLTTQPLLPMLTRNSIEDRRTHSVLSTCIETSSSQNAIEKPP